MQITRHQPELLRVLERFFTSRRELWLVMHKDARAIRRVRPPYEHLAGELADYVQGKR